MNQIHDKTVGYQGVLMSVREAGVRRLYSLPSGVRCQPSPGGRGGVRFPKRGDEEDSSDSGLQGRLASKTTEYLSWASKLRLDWDLFMCALRR